MTTAVEDHVYDESGLPGIVLEALPVKICTKCGSRRVGFQRLGPLHDLIARVLVLKRQQLTPQETRFLCSHLGWTASELCNAVGHPPWWAGYFVDLGYSLGRARERILRLAVLASMTGPAIDSKLILEMGRAEERPTPMRLRFDGERWVLVEPKFGSEEARVAGALG